MKTSVIVAATAASVLVGCQTAQQQNVMWMRTDGQRTVGNPKLEQEFYVAGTVCEGRANGVAAGSAPVYGWGLAGSINAAIIVGQKNQQLFSFFKGCMAEQGYILVPKTADARPMQGFRPAPPRT
jgi:hypothetical protein